MTDKEGVFVHRWLITAIDELCGGKVFPSVE
jgi:hypothetical protein